MPNSALPDNLKGRRHEDWPWPFSLIPRGWTAFKINKVPTLFIGEVYEWEFGGIRPVQLMGWHIDFIVINKYIKVPIWFCITFKNSKKYFGFGMRWDGSDDYYQFPSILYGSIDNYDERYKEIFK